MKIKIRKAKPQDLKAINQILHLNDVLHSHYKVNQEELQSNYFNVLLLEKQVVGFFSIAEISTNLSKLNHLYLHPNYQGKGYGSYLLNYVLREQQSVAKFFLEAAEQVKDFYEQFSFESLGYIEHYSGEKIYLMEKSQPSYSNFNHNQII